MIDVMLCVNHPRDGSPAGRISKVEIREVDLELEGPMDWDNFELLGTTEFRRHKDLLKIGGMVLVHHGYGTWVGNRCWDSATMQPAEVIRLLNHLKALRWDCNAAVPSLFDRWRRPGDLTLEDLARAGLDVAADTPGRPTP